MVAPWSLDTTADIERFCQTKGVTFNSYVAAALLRSVRRHTPARDRFALYTAASLRRLRSSAPLDDYGCALSIVPTFHRIDGERPLVSIAAEHQQALLKSFVAYGRPPADYSIRALQDAVGRLADSRVFVHDIGFTYAESVLRPGGGLAIEHAYVAANRSAGNVAVVLHGLRIGTRTFFTLSHTEPLQDARWAAEVGASLQTALRDTPL
jgi:hypothetical protein